MKFIISFIMNLNSDFHIDCIGYINQTEKIIIINCNYYYYKDYFSLHFAIINYCYKDHYSSNCCCNSYNHIYFAIKLAIM